jgi:AcrR family transcriptional regulator
MSSDIPARDRILQAAGELFTHHGFANVTMLEVATRARVSKRELYALVGNKDELLAACVAARGSRMRLPEGYPAPKDREALRAALHAYGATLLRELTEPGVVAMFRLGIAEAKRSPAVAQSIQERGRGPARDALAEILRAAKAAHLLADPDIARMTSHFNALLWGDLMVWLLLGLEKAPAPKEIERRAAEATDLFLALHGSA